jgi:hypothetical protein
MRDEDMDQAALKSRMSRFPHPQVATPRNRLCRFIGTAAARILELPRN